MCYLKKECIIYPLAFQCPYPFFRHFHIETQRKVHVCVCVGLKMINHKYILIYYSPIQCIRFNAHIKKPFPHFIWFKLECISFSFTLPMTGEFSAQMASNAENVFIWWRHHDHSDSCVFTQECYPMMHRKYGSISGQYHACLLRLVSLCCQGHLLLTWINLDPSMDR